GIVVEKLTPGPNWGGLPVMTMPVVLPNQSRENRLMLSLYYRWALQALSAICYLHSRSIYIKTFSAGHVWLLTTTTNQGQEQVKDKSFSWATFVWRLMTNDHTPEAHWIRGNHDWKPTSPPEVGGPARSEDGSEVFQDLEVERLGPVLVKAWKCGYKSAEEVAEDIRKIAETVGITIVGDEVEIDEAWEDVFEVVETKDWKWGPQLRF
ncbi:hypothetical protein EJ02DRAFT_299859, partial [Clathrospora elynae]